MSTMSKPTLILINGGWHSPSCWQKYLVPAFESKGYKCVVPQMVYGNTDVPLPNIKLAIEQVAGLISTETSQGNDVVLINHSFGGSVGCSAVRGFSRNDPSRLTPGHSSGHVIGIAQICAFLGRKEFLAS